MNKFAKIGSILLIFLGLVGLVSDIIHTSIFIQSYLHMMLDFRMVINISFHLIWVVLGIMILLNKQVRISFIVVFVLFVGLGLYNYIWVVIQQNSSFVHPWLPVLNMIFGISVIFVSVLGLLRQREMLTDWRNNPLFGSLSYLVFGYIGWMTFAFVFTMVDVSPHVSNVFDPSSPLEGENLGIVLYAIMLVAIYLCQILSGVLLYNELKRDELDG